MRIAGIIAEYDPFHKGHEAHIAATRSEIGGQATHIIAVISGNFTQRGEPALLSKFRRTEMALAGGADLILELPLPWAMAPAQNFAMGGVAVLKGLGCVDLLSFGSECGDTAALSRLADISLTPAYRSTLQQALTSGLPYAAAVQSAAALDTSADASILSSPNNTLGIEYLRASAVQNTGWKYYTLKRQGALHTDSAPKDGFSSATLLREAVRNGRTSETVPYMPPAVHEILTQAVESGEIADVIRLERALMAPLRRMSKSEYANLPWLSEGLENRFYAASRTAADIEQLFAAVKTRRYPMSRLRRILWSAFIGMEAEDTQGLPPYIRILGMNERGKEILAAASPTLPLITRSVQIQSLDKRAQRIFALECTATDLHALSMANPLPCGTDLTTKLIVT